MRAPAPVLSGLSEPSSTGVVATCAIVDADVFEIAGILCDTLGAGLKPKLKNNRLRTR